MNLNKEQLKKGNKFCKLRDEKRSQFESIDKLFL